MSDHSNAMRLTVINTEPNDPGDPFGQPQHLDHLANHDQIFIGRSPSNQITFNANSVSGRHACISRQGNDYYITDLQSRNGTFLNNSQLVPNEQKPLRNGDRIRITPYEISFQSGIEVLSSITEDTAMLQQQLIDQLLIGIDDIEEVPPKLVLVSGYRQQLTLELVAFNTEFKIGRSPHCDLLVQDENISREHAILRRTTSKGVFIRDNNSRNGIVINGNRVPRNTEIRLKDRDEFLLGTIKFRFEDPEGARFDRELDDVVAEPEPEVVPQKEAISVPKPKSPPPPIVGGEEAEGDIPPPGEGEDIPPPPGEGGEEPPLSAEGAEGAEGETPEGEDDGPPAPPPPTGLTSGQKAFLGGLIALFLIGGALLFFLT